MNVLDRGEFRKWLVSMGDADISPCNNGSRYYSETCAIGRFLGAKAGAACMANKAIYFQIGRHADQRPTPAWAQQFIVLFDAAWDTITARKALAMLDSIPGAEPPRKAVVPAGYWDRMAERLAAETDVSANRRSVADGAVVIER